MKQVVQHIGIAEFRYADVTVVLRNASFTVSADGFPELCAEDRAHLRSVRDAAVQEGLSECESTLFGRESEQPPWRFVVRWQPELGSMFDVYEPGKPPRLGLQEPLYKAHVLHQQRLAEEANGKQKPVRRLPSVEVRDSPGDGVLDVKLPRGWKLRRSGKKVQLVRNRRKATV